MFNFCDEYLFTKGTVVKNIINGRLYLVISRKEKGETWTCSLREINASETEILYNKTIVLNFKEDHAKMTRMNSSIYHLVRPAFPKLKDEYSVENGVLMKNNEPVSDYSDLLAEYGKTAESVSLHILGVTDISVIYADLVRVMPAVLDTYVSQLPPWAGDAMDSLLDIVKKVLFWMQIYTQPIIRV